MRTLQEHIRLSAVIPVLDAADALPSTLAALVASPLVGEIVIVDGGSHDESAVIARDAGARVIQAPRGRGSQLAAGAEAASAEWLLFLHADCKPLSPWEEAARMFVAGSGNSAGYFTLALDDEAPAARRVSRKYHDRAATSVVPREEVISRRCEMRG